MCVFVEERNLTFPVLLDATLAVTKGKYHLRGILMSVFVDRAGIIRRVHIRLMTREQIDVYIGALLQ
jgi:hypothetical protein